MHMLKHSITMLRCLYWQGIMVPSYHLVEAAHALVAVFSILHPRSPTGTVVEAVFAQLLSFCTVYPLPHTTAIMDTYCTLCIFTYTRIYYVMLRAVNMGVGNEYTLSIFLAGVTVSPLVFGPFSSVGVLIAFWLYFRVLAISNRVAITSPGPCVCLACTGCYSYQHVTARRTRWCAAYTSLLVEHERDTILSSKATWEEVLLTHLTLHSLSCCRFTLSWLVQENDRAALAMFRRFDEGAKG